MAQSSKLFSTNMSVVMERTDQRIIAIVEASIVRRHSETPQSLVVRAIGSFGEGGQVIVACDLKVGTDKETGETKYERWFVPYDRVLAFLPIQKVN